jgi:nucleoside-diphosphate-sugar epimerase
MPRKLIIGCGYLGRRVAKRWVAAGDSVFALTRSEDRAAELRGLGIEPIVGDVTRPESLASLPQADVVLYAVGFDRAAGNSMRSVYIDGLQNALDRLAAATRRFVYVSSTSVYGQTNGEWIDADSPCEPTRENGAVCLAAERLVWQAFPSMEQLKAEMEQLKAEISLHQLEVMLFDRFFRALGRSANVLRLAGIYGPGRLLRRVEAVRSGGPVDGNPDAFLNLIHVEDAAAAVDACLERGRPGRTYLISDDRPVTRREYFESLATHLNAPPPVFTADAAAARTPGLNKRCRNRRMKEELQVALQYPTITEGLNRGI